MNLACDFMYRKVVVRFGNLIVQIINIVKNLIRFLF